MDITTISVTYSRKVNLGDYNSADVSLSLWAQVDPAEEDPSLAIAELQNQAKDTVCSEIETLKEEIRTAAESRRKRFGQPVNSFDEQRQ